MDYTPCEPDVLISVQVEAPDPAPRYMSKWAHYVRNIRMEHVPAG